MQPPPPSVVSTISIEHVTDAVVAASGALRQALAQRASTAVAHAFAIAVRELATNIQRHGGGGEVQLGMAPGLLWVRALDRGPGIADVESALRDHWSAGRPRPLGVAPTDGLGCGLGAVRRLMDGLELHARDGGGLEVTAWKRIVGPR
ncbi:MAG: ATP-binding protein [Deltaproteobacteria bacterium]|nr:ATP-binding protein [Deltaproteobacteria bacterium]